VSVISIDLEDPDAVALWAKLADLVDRLPGEWVLIGGLMVQLHAVEHGVTDVRATTDIDVLGQARPPGTLTALDAALKNDGFTLVGPDIEGYAHRYERDGLIVDVLGPDGIRPPPALAEGTAAIPAPGGSQALARSELVSVEVGGRTFELKRPTLLGAILIKARSLMVHHDPDAQREDLLRLLALVEDPREMAADLRKTERQWLRRADHRLDAGSPSTLSGADARRAVQAYALLVGES
jgi:hypothetical protein